MPEAIIKTPYISKGKRINRSSHHHDMWIIDIIGTNTFYAITMSQTLMIQNNPPDAEVNRVHKGIVNLDTATDKLSAAAKTQLIKSRPKGIVKLNHK